ncbi:MAG: sugar ABC transporter permease [Clostridia bacterium]|nr:sugar ABC transporter permease [Clostridia bacterium]
MSKLKKKSIFKYATNYAFVLPYLTIFFLFTVLPVLISIFLSFTYYNVIETPVFNGLANYQRLFFSDDLFTKALSNTMVLALIIGPGGYVLSFGFAWILNEFKPKIRTFLTFFLYAPSLSGGAFAIWAIIYSGDRYGWLNSILLSLNIISEPIQWLTDTNYMLPCAAVSILWMSLGTSFLSFIAGFQTVDGSLYEAASVDGITNRWQELWYITIPSMLPQMMFGAVMSITASFGVGPQITALFGNPSTNYELYTVVHQLEDYGSTRFEMGYASAIATVLFVIMFVSNEVVKKLLAKVGH